MNIDNHANQKKPAVVFILLWFYLECLTRKLRQNIVSVLQLLKGDGWIRQCSLALKGLLQNHKLVIVFLSSSEKENLPGFLSVTSLLSDMPVVSCSRTRECISPLSLLGSPGVGLGKERRLKAGPDEKRGCHSIVARLACLLMELCWVRAPWGSTWARGACTSPR